MHNLELFFTLSHTLPLHNSHLNTGFLNAELQANWHGIKPTKWLIKFNLIERIGAYPKSTMTMLTLSSDRQSYRVYAFLGHYNFPSKIPNQSV